MNQTTSRDPNQAANPGADPKLAPPSAGQISAQNVEMMRVKYGAWLVGAAFVLLGVVLGIAVSRFNTAADVAAVVGSVATVIGTIIGAFFGVQVGSSGKEAAEARGNAAEAKSNQAERVTRMALAKLDPGAADEVIKAL